MLSAIPPESRGAAIAGLAAQLGMQPAELAAFMQSAAAAGAAPGAPGPAGVAVALSPAEAASIKRMQEMGFSQQQCLEAFLACDKNEERALNYLLNQGGFQ